MIFDYLKYSVLAILTAAAVALAGCSSDNDGPAPVDPSVDDQVILRLNVAIGDDDAVDDASRAGNDPNGGYENAASGNFEGVATLRVIILHSDRSVEANRMVVTQPNGKPINDNLEFRVSSNEVKWIYLIANEASLPVPVPGYETVSTWLDSFDRDDPLPASVMQSWTTGFSASQVSSGDVTASLVSSGTLSRLPLTEVFRVSTMLTGSETTVTPGDGGDDDQSGATSVVVNRLKEVDLFMIRAAAKATFTFDLRNFTGIGGYITGVRLLGINQSEYVFPRYTSGTAVGSATYTPAKYTGGESEGNINPAENDQRYISAFDSPADNSVISYTLPFSQTQRIRLAATSGSTISRGPIYFPESRSSLSSNAYTVQIQVDGDRWLDAQPLKDNILTFDGIQAIARNTHLRINITVGENNSLMYTVVPDPWTPETYTFDYADNIGIAENGRLTFVDGTYRSLDDETGRIVLNNYPAVLRGSFSIATPVGARWDAYIITQSGEPNAIQFVVPSADGQGTEYTDHIHGLVPTPTSFSIAPVSAAGATSRTATLQVLVTLPNGTTLSAEDILNGDQFGENVHFVTFIQNPQQ